MDKLTDTELRKVLSRVWSLGQLYWQQADSDSWRQHDKADETRQKYLELVDEALAALASDAGAPQGWKLAPIEPTNEMIMAGSKFIPALHVWNAMLSAAPAPVAANAADAGGSNMADAYVGAREDLEIWKRRALEAEELNRKFMASVNGPTHMGEPVIAPPNDMAISFDKTIATDAAAPSDELTVDLKAYEAARDSLFRIEDICWKRGYRYEGTFLDWLDRTLAAPQAALSDELAQRLKAAIEGECDGLAISDAHATAILEYVLDRSLMSEVQPDERTREALQACVDVMLHDGVPTDPEHPANIALTAAESVLSGVQPDERATCVHADDPKACYRVRCQLGNKCVDDDMSPRAARKAERGEGQS